MVARRLRFQVLLATACAAVAVAQPAAANRIADVRVEAFPDNAVVTVVGSTPPSFNSFVLNSPDRLVIDLAGSQLAKAPMQRRVQGAPVLAVETHQLIDATNATARVLIQLIHGAEYDIKTSGNNLVVAIWPGATATTAPAPVAKAEDKPAPAPAPAVEEPKPAAPVEVAMAEPPAPPPPVVEEPAPAPLVEAKPEPVPEPVAKKEPAPEPWPEVAAPAEKAAPVPVAVAMVEKKETPPPVVEAPAPVVETKPEPAPAPAVPARTLFADEEEETVATVTAPPKQAEPARSKPLLVAQMPPEQPPPPPPPVSAPPTLGGDSPPPGMTPSMGQSGETPRGPQKPDPGTRELQFVGFKMLPTRARVFARLDGVGRFSVSQLGADTVVIELSDCRVGKRNNLRPLFTNFFPGSPVEKIQAEKVSGTYTRVEIKMKNKVPFVSGQDGNVVYVDFETAGIDGEEEEPIN